MAENLADVADYPAAQDIIRPLDNPVKKDSHLVILYGNLAPEGSVAKITGKEGLRFEGRAIVFHSEEQALQAILDGKVEAGHVAYAERSQGLVGDGSHAGRDIPGNTRGTAKQYGAGFEVLQSVIVDVEPSAL